MFIGQYKYNLDGKGRVVIPGDYRRQLGNRVIINKGIEKCIVIYPPEVWQKQVEKIGALSFARRDNRVFNRYLMSSAFEKEIDGQGRIKLEDSLIAYAGICKECIVVGVGNVIEIWAADAWLSFEAGRDCDLETISEGIDL